MGKKLKVALFGNMNNNNFAIMRYFRDLGVNAHLFLFKEDGRGSSSHFSPEDDTWYMESWAPYIHNLNLSSRWQAFAPDLSPGSFSLPPTRRKVKKEFKSHGLYDYDRYVGSGLTPAILNKGDIYLDIFYPYSNGIEYVGHVLTRKELEKLLSPKKFLYLYLRKEQVKGIKKARFCLNAEMGMTKETFNEIGEKFLPLAIPMVYNREQAEESHVCDDLKKIGRLMLEFDLSIISHASHKWVRKSFYSDEEWEKTSKHNDLLLYGFAQFIETEKHAHTKLFLLEYGNDVRESKQLCQELNIEEHVIWLPQMSRKEIMYLLSKCDIGVGEFYEKYGTIWGGTGWEVLASGKPLLQAFNFTEKDYVTKFGHPSPPICNVKSKEDISRYLMNFMHHKDKYKTIGHKSKEWFEKYNGMGLAKKWLDLIV